MIDFFREAVTIKIEESKISNWIGLVIRSENKKEGELSFIFCSDEYLFNLNRQFLNHDTFTDVISFDNSLGNELNGEIYVSIDRVADNAKKFKVSFDEELRRVLIHGVLHFCGYKDKNNEDIVAMRRKENEKLAMFHVEHD